MTLLAIPVWYFEQLNACWEQEPMCDGPAGLGVAILQWLFLLPVIIVVFSGVVTALWIDVFEKIENKFSN
ncbi:hypothetical protein FHS89_002682 [Rubricella aquisinus]|uniref:Uncharacterized protein n=1 Tax=Rubricella aquisinus TaxID=2028108 RepID=A0A840WSJ8_9RHOB|nr:hypothetical protein [Rubricella aquisinus]MBB5516642.1 hypothetical protein [Rubricella aquisinus]